MMAKSGRRAMMERRRKRRSAMDRRRPHAQQPRRIPRANRALGDAIRRQLEVERGEADHHHAGVGATRRSNRTSGIAISTAQTLPTI